MHPADIPAIREPILEPSDIRVSRLGLSLIPCAVSRDQLRRQGRPAPVQHGRQRGDSSTTAIRKTLSAVM
jgi:hypothetical protein